MKVLTKDGEKLFINICHTEDVPHPTKMTVIPMSIGNEKEVTDRSEFH